MPFDVLDGNVATLLAQADVPAGLCGCGTEATEALAAYEAWEWCVWQAADNFLARQRPRDRYIAAAVADCRARGWTEDELRHYFGAVP